MSTWPALDSGDWSPTRDTLHQRIRVVGAVAKALAESHPHWWHVALLPEGAGLVTRPLLGPDGEFTLTVDLSDHTVFVEGGGVVPLDQPGPAFLAGITGALAAAGAEVPLDADDFASSDVYDPEAVQRYAAVLAAATPLLGSAITSLPGETSPVQLWPHHFDLAATWFSGRLVPGADPDDVENAAEIVGLGFSTGDSTVSEAYCYGYAYPTPDGLGAAPLPAPASWHTEGFTGGVLRYGDALATGDPAGAVSAFWRTFLVEAAARMA